MGEVKGRVTGTTSIILGSFQFLITLFGNKDGVARQAGDCLNLSESAWEAKV